MKCTDFKVSSRILYYLNLYGVNSSSDFVLLDHLNLDLFIGSEISLQD